LNGKRANLYDTDWNPMPFKMIVPKSRVAPIPAPPNLGEMLDVARKLCKDFKLVRVDLYDVAGKLYFGEMTFTPASGSHIFQPEEYDLKIGQLLRLT
jgi:hypothetical protein